jgi:predicted DNA-binding transcriptional regulator YafY
MSKTARIFELVRILRAKGFMSKQQILDRFEVTEPTFKRDLAFLRDEYGAQVKYDPQEKVYRLVSAGTVPLGAIPSGDMAEIPGLWFNEQELHSLLTMYELLKGYGGQGVVGESLAPFREKIETLLARMANDKRHRSSSTSKNEKPTVFTGATLEERSQEVRHRIRVLPMAARRTPGEQLTQVADAVVSRKRLRITYHNRKRDDQTKRDISPQRLVHYRDNWYVDAYCHLKNRLSTFSVDSITAAKTLQEPAVEISEQELEEVLVSSYGIFSGIPTGECELLFSPERSRWVCDEVWHPNQKGQWTESSEGRKWKLKFPYSDLRELLMDVLKHGDHVHVLKPQELNDQVKKVAMAMLKNTTRDG